MLNDYGKDLFKPWLSVSNILLLLAVFFVIALFKLTSSELASWVQAVGSIAAILGAFSISNSQNVKEKKRVALESVSKLDGMFAVVKSAVDHSSSFVEFVGKTPNIFVYKTSWDTVYSEALSGSVESLKAIPAHELGSYELVVQFMMIRGAVSKVANPPRSLTGAFAEQELIFMYHAIASQSTILQFSWSEFEYAYNEKRLELLVQSDVVE